MLLRCRIKDFPQLLRSPCEARKGSKNEVRHYDSDTSDFGWQRGATHEEASSRKEPLEETPKHQFPVSVCSVQRRTLSGQVFYEMSGQSEIPIEEEGWKHASRAHFPHSPHS